MRIVCIVAVLMGLNLLSAEEYKLPPAVQKKIDSHQEEVTKIIQEAKKDIQDSQDKMIKALEKELKAETRKGHFNNAMAITELIEGLKKQDEEVGSIFGKNLNIEMKPSRIKILKVALADGDMEKQGQIPHDLIKHVQMKIGRGEYVFNFKKDFAPYFPKGFTFTKGWIDYSLDDGPKVYMEAKGADFVVTIPEPLPKE